MTKQTSAKRWWRWLAGAVALVVVCGVAGWYMMAMPGRSSSSMPTKLAPATNALAKALRADVVHLSQTIGIRSVYRPTKLKQARLFLSSRLRSLGYTVREVGYKMQSSSSRINGQWVANIEASRKGTKRPHEIVVIGAHYDSYHLTTGANDNASGTAALLALAKLFQTQRWERTVRFVAFVNEEPPFFQNSQMGSLYYARVCRSKNEHIVAMLSLETIGSFFETPNSQSYPPPINLFYPSTGNFIGFVSNLSSRSLLHRVVRTFRKKGKIPSEGIATFSMIPGIGWSDHWAFWQAGYPGVMVTDTAPFRYVHYHKVSDTPDKLDFQKMALVVEGLVPVIDDLAGAK